MRFNLFPALGNHEFNLKTIHQIVEKAVFHCTNAYAIPNVRAIGFVCKTNLPSNTAFRGFGGPQAMFAIENIIRELARIVKRPDYEIAELNLFTEGSITHYNQTLVNCNIERYILLLRVRLHHLEFTKFCWCLTVTKRIANGT